MRKTLKSLFFMSDCMEFRIYFKKLFLKVLEIEDDSIGTKEWICHLRIVSIFSEYNLESTSSKVGSHDGDTDGDGLDESIWESLMSRCIDDGICSSQILEDIFLSTSKYDRVLESVSLYLSSEILECGTIAHDNIADISMSFIYESLHNTENEGVVFGSDCVICHESRDRHEDMFSMDLLLDRTLDRFVFELFNTFEIDRIIESDDFFSRDTQVSPEIGAIFLTIDDNSLGTRIECPNEIFIYTPDESLKNSNIRSK